MANQQKYGKIIEDMEHEVIEKKDPFPKNISDACRISNGWQNNYGGGCICTKANDGVGFTTMSEDKDEQKKNGKKKEITCFICKKNGHYASECNEELPPRAPNSGSNILLVFCKGRLLHKYGERKETLYYTVMLG